jgi:hypothetical protein
VNLNTQLTNTVLHELQKDISQRHPQRRMHHAYDVADSYIGPHVLDGYSALRAEVAAAAAVDNFRIWNPGGINVAFAGATTNGYPLEPFRPMAFRFAARVFPDGNLLRIRIVFRTAAAAIAGYVTQAEEIQAAAAVIVRGAQSTWGYHCVSFVPPQQVGANVLDHAVMQVSNGTAGAQLIDIDALQWGPTDQTEDL